MGFPSEIVDDPLLSLVSPEEEAFQNAEERRVMYVAMTRARHTLTILASNARPSSFVTELRKDPAYGISTAPGAEPEAHVCGECGGRLLGVTGQDGRIWYRCEHVQHCGNLLPALPATRPCHALPRGRARCAAGAVPAIRLARIAKTAGWSSEAAALASSSAAFAIRPVPEKRRSRMAISPQSPRQGAGERSDVGRAASRISPACPRLVAQHSVVAQHPDDDGPFRQCLDLIGGPRLICCGVLDHRRTCPRPAPVRTAHRAAA